MTRISIRAWETVAASAGYPLACVRIYVRGFCGAPLPRFDPRSRCGDTVLQVPGSGVADQLSSSPQVCRAAPKIFRLLNARHDDACRAPPRADDGSRSPHRSRDRRPALGCGASALAREYLHLRSSGRNQTRPPLYRRRAAARSRPVLANLRVYACPPAMLCRGALTRSPAFCIVFTCQTMGGARAITWLPYL